MRNLERIWSEVGELHSVWFDWKVALVRAAGRESGPCGNVSPSSPLITFNYCCEKWHVRRGHWFLLLTVSSSTDGASLRLPHVVRKTSRKPATPRSGRVNQSRRISTKATGGIQFLPLHPPAQCQNRLRPSVVNVPDHAKNSLYIRFISVICVASPPLNSPERRKVPLYFRENSSRNQHWHLCQVRDTSATNHKWLPPCFCPLPGMWQARQSVGFSRKLKVSVFAGGWKQGDKYAVF